MQPPQIAAPPTIAGPGPVRCDGSSSDDDEQGIVKVKFGAEDQGPLGIEFKEVSIKSCNPGGMGQFRAGRPLEAGMILRTVPKVPRWSQLEAPAAGDIRRSWGPFLRRAVGGSV